MIAVLAFVLLVHGSHSWRLDATLTQVHHGRAENAKLTCRYNSTDNTQSRMKEVAVVMILKADDDPQQPWMTYASVKDAVLFLSGEDGVIVRGQTGQVAQSYLSVIWEMTSEDTVGTYKCQVEGYTYLDTPVRVKTPTVTLESNTQTATLEFNSTEWKTIVNLFLGYEERSDNFQRRSSESKKKADRFLKQADESLKQADKFQREAANFQREAEAIHSKAITLLKYKYNGLVTWPEGKFALLKADSGCPTSKNGEKWLDGYVKFHTESSGGGKNGDSVSNPSHMATPVMKREGEENLFYMYTCRQDNVGLIKLAWPKGKYCILQGLTGGLPGNFSEGYIHFDVEDVSPYLSKSLYGPRPDADVNRLYFECRDDGDPSIPIELPVETPFFLFRRGGRCQEVFNAKVTEESFTVDTEDSSNNDKINEAVPDGEINPVRLHTCYYQPIV